MVVASQLVFYPHKIPQNKNGTVRILLLSVPNIVDSKYHTETTVENYDLVFSLSIRAVVHRIPEFKN